MTQLDALKGASIAFDLDGTLVDTAPDLVRALNESIAPFGLAPVPVDDVRAMVGRGARALIERAFVRAGAALDSSITEAALAHFLKTYGDDIAAMSRPFDGVEAALDVLAVSGARLSVCTNKPSALARKLIDALELSHRFERITGPEDTSAKKPDPAHLLTAAGEGAPDRFIALVGDSEPDVLSARGAGAAAVIFTRGYSEKPVSTLGADRLFDSFRELPAILAKLAARRG
ncbi:MAG: phosphoglycolate phosphatase [Caulobacterales bacterium]|uniref:phosphoglycolate phosphatase n=1 Tax=Glycocaulis sp. TaxID=1969725 RepID=UPI003F9FE226